ncbi:MAG TPA: M20/M25/M40 family metallo-hydrolase [Clostridia bacterium]|nr:M20/M25/M40 family metallo-hydrolase [Clostridia bacterium]
MIQEKRLVQEFIEMVQIDSLSRQEGKFAAYLENKLRTMGLEVIIDQKAGKKAGSDAGNIIARLPGEKRGAPVIFISAHMDTVPLGVCIKPCIENGVIYSDGETILGGDDKAGIAIILETLRHLQEEKIAHGDLEIVFTIGEEIGLLGARYLDLNLLRAAFGFVLDSDGAPGTIINQAPVQETLNVIIHGKAAHAGMEPEKGICAIRTAAEAISQMNLQRIDEETTANIGIIKGGEVTNIICDRVELAGEARSLSEKKLIKQVKEMVSCLERACQKTGAVLTIETEREYSAFKLAKSESVVKAAIGAAKALGLQPKLVASGGASDANYFNARGLPTVNLGIGMCNAHTCKESIKIKDLVKGAHYLTAIIQFVSGEKI